LGFKLDWGLVAESGVFAVGVVVGIDVGEDFGSSVLGIDEAAVLKHFGFKCSHEGFGPGVVIGIGPSRHALAYSSLAQKLSIGPTAILTASVAMEDWLLSCAT